MKTNKAVTVGIFVYLLFVAWWLIPDRRGAERAEAELVISNIRDQCKTVARFEGVLDGKFERPILVFDNRAHPRTIIDSKPASGISLEKMPSADRIRTVVAVNLVKTEAVGSYTVNGVRVSHAYKITLSVCAIKWPKMEVTAIKQFEWSPPQSEAISSNDPSYDAVRYRKETLDSYFLKRNIDGRLHEEIIPWLKQHSL